MTSRTSLTPAVTADNRSNDRLVVEAINSAIVVLPVPGGPHKMIEEILSDSISLRSALPGAVR